MAEISVVCYLYYITHERIRQIFYNFPGEADGSGSVQENGKVIATPVEHANGRPEPRLGQTRKIGAVFAEVARCRLQGFVTTAHPDSGMPMQDVLAPSYWC